MVARLSQVSRLLLITDGKDGLGGTVTRDRNLEGSNSKGITEGAERSGEAPT